MADKLFSDIISGRTDLDHFQEWLMGKETQIINSTVSRTDFVLFVLKYIREETNKYIPVPSSTIQPTLKDSQSSQEKLLDKKPLEKESKTPEEEFKNQRVPFQVVNKVTPTRTVTQQFARHLNSGYDFRRDSQHSLSLDSRNILTSTPLQSAPIHPRRNTSRNDHFPISPPGSFHSDHSSPSHTPRSTKSSRFNSSGGSHSFSPNSPQSPSFSPTSPQYSDSFPDLSARSRPRAPQSPCLGDFITTKRASQKSRKRIKPTQLSTPEKDVGIECKKGNKISFGVVNRPFVPISPIHTEAKEQSNFDEERNLLKQKRIQILKSSEDNSQCGLPSTVLNIVSLQDGKEQTPPKLKNSLCLKISEEKSSLGSSPQNAKYVTVDPHPSLVKSVSRILRLATVYSSCLDANLIPNITVEFCTIFTLLTVSYKTKVSESENSSLGSLISNNTKESSSGSGICNNLLDQLCLSDRVQTNETSSCPSEEQTFSREEQKQVLNQHETKNVFSSAHDCVMFSALVIEKQIHTLQCFDKGVIRLLVENTRLSLFLPHLTPQLVQIAEVKEAKEAACSPTKKSFPVENGPVLYHSETDNRDNFSSLENFNFFKKQRDGFYEILHEWRTKNSDNNWISKRFPQRVQALLALSSDPVNMMHLARLFCAQMTSFKSEPHEEFEMAGVPRDKLNRLQARFSKPAERGGSPRPPPAFPDEQQFYLQFLHLTVGCTFLQHVADCLIYRLHLLDLTDFFMDGLTVEESKAQILACLSNSCLIAKFLGLVVFLPYRTTTPLAPDTLQAQIMVREQLVPPVNVLPQLQRALDTNRLVVTVPWVVAFLGMMDSVAPYLACYHSLLQLLVSIYKALPLSHLSPLSNLLLRCSLGWLFDMSFFPQHVFFSLISSSSGLDNKSMESSDADVRDVVDQTLLCEACPYLSHLRQLLTPSAGVRQGVPRHITPVPAQLTPATQTSLVQTMELQLEECFLNGQSTSFRTTVEMIIDRLSSTCIKHICSNVIAPAKEKASEAIRTLKVEMKSTDKQVQVWISEQCQQTEAEVEAAVGEYCGPRVETALSLLLGQDLADLTLCRTTNAICARRCRERIVNWLNSHIKLTDIYTKLIPTLDSKQNTDLMKPLRRKSVELGDRVTAPADMIIELQDKLCECIENRGSVMNEQQVMDLFSKALQTVKHRNDLIAIAEHTIFTLTVDLCIVLLAYSPLLVTTAVVSQLCALWSVCGVQGSCQLERVMSARNTLLLCQGGVELARASWKHLSVLLVELLKHSPPLLTPSQLETQCVALFRLDWPPMVLTLMGACLSSMLEKIKQDPICKQNPKFVLLLEWVNEMTEDLSREDSFEGVL